MKILIVSYELWDGVTNGGNVLSNIFDGFDGEFAQIFCVSGTPYNKVCKRYFQITDQMVIHREKMGRELVFDDYPANIEGANPKGDTRRTVTYFRSSLMLLREMAWSVSKWKTKELEKFILDFKPDVIFAPCNPIPHVLKIQRYVKKIAKCPMISYVYDDIYSLKKFSLSPVYWLNHFINRKHIRRVFKDYDFVFTMTEKQKSEYERYFKRPMGILRKSGSFENEPRTNIAYPVKLIYAGGVYINRWKVLKEVKNALAKINKEGKKAELHIYTANKVSKRQEKAMADGDNSFLHSAVSTEELKELYKNSHIALHVEAFSLKSRLDTRLSFSTKIVDCLESGCAVVAIGPKGQAGIEYLRENGAAVCISSKKEILKEISKLINSFDIIKEYAIFAEDFGKREHIKKNNKERLDKLFKDMT
ncbi:MAG: hypothetical protein J6B45_05605 [Clostridia bacterium]|nr:hypothetical protein [Clostridia bacterium]